MEEAVLFSVENHVATITLNRPKSLNSMNDKLIDGLHEALDMAEQDEEIRCVVLTGSGKAFLCRRRPAVFGSIARCRCPPCLYY